MKINEKSDRIESTLTQRYAQIKRKSSEAHRSDYYSKIESTLTQEYTHKKRQRNMGSFKAGEQVRLISGGPPMTVVGYKTIRAVVESAGDVRCAWFGGDEYYESNFNEKTLTKVNDDGAIEKS